MWLDTAEATRKDGAIDRLLDVFTNFDESLNGEWHDMAVLFAEEVVGIVESLTKTQRKRLKKRDGIRAKSLRAEAIKVLTAYAAEYQGSGCGCNGGGV